MGMQETSTVRMMRSLVTNHKVGDSLYAYQFAKEVGTEPQRARFVLMKWVRRGYLTDDGLAELPEGIGMGPAVRLFVVTELGIQKITEALAIIDSRKSA